MTYKIPMLNMPVFSSDSINEAFKSMGDVPQMNIEVDFHTEYLYKLFIKKTIAEYVNKVSPNICQLMVNSEILKCILRDNPNVKFDDLVNKITEAAPSDDLGVQSTNTATVTRTKISIFDIDI